MGGAQDRTIQLAEHFSEGKPVILTKTPRSKIISNYADLANYEDFSVSNVLKYSRIEDVVFLSHHRELTTKLVLISRFFGKKLRIVHCARNTFDNLRLLTLFPSNIIANSNGVKENLISYFHVKPQDITVIFNGIDDCYNNRNIKIEAGKIRLILAGRICPVKRQVELVNALKGKIADYIHIDFAGKGPDEQALIESIGDSPQFGYIGYVNMEDCLNQYDYVLLFSEREGLSSSLIYGLMFYKPLVTNNLPTMTDANKAGEVGYVYNNLSELIDGLNNLPFPTSQEYKEMSLRCRSRYERYFTEKRMFEQYEDYFSKLMAKNNE